MRNGKWKKLCLVFIAFFAVVVFCSCSCSCSEEPELEISVNSLVLETDAGSGLNVKKNDRFTISYTIAPTNATVSGVYISSSNSHCVMVIDDEMDESHGEPEFQAVGEGKCVITFITKDGGHKKTCEVTVYEPKQLQTPQNISFDGTKLVWDDTNASTRLCDEKYIVSITSDGVTRTFSREDNEFLNNSSFTFAEEKHYEVTVKAVGDNIKNSDSQVSRSYRFYILKTPKYEVSAGDITWSFAQVDGNFNNPNFYKIQYNEAGDYKIVENPKNRTSDNVYKFSKQHLELDDFYVSIQAIKVPANLTKTDVELLIEEAKSNGTSTIHGFVNGIDYISSNPTNGFSLHRTSSITNVHLENNNLGGLTINNIDFDNAYQPSVIKFDGENDYYLGRVKYCLTFKREGGNKEKTIELPAGATEYALDEDFKTNVIQELGKTPQTIPGVIPYYLSTYSVTISAKFATDADASSIIIGPSSPTYTFTYFEVPATLLDMELDSTNATLTYKNPTHNETSYFDGFQFIFVNPTTETKDYKIIEPETDAIDLKAALQGLQGSYQIWINLKGNIGTGFNLGSMNVLGLKYESGGGEPEVIKTIAAPTGLRLKNDGTILWNRVEGAKEYRVELKINETTTYFETVADSDAGGTHNLHTLLENWDSSYADLTIGKSYEIRVVSIAAEEGVIDSASEALVFQKLNQVQNVKYKNGVVSWDELSGVSRYMISINNGATVEVLGNVLEQNVYADSRLHSAIYADASMRNTISIWAIGSEGAGTLDSMPTSIEVSRSKAPTLESISNGRLYWDTNGIVGDLYKITIKLANSDDKFAEIDGISGEYFDLTGIETTENLKVYVQRYSENTFNSTENKPMYFKKLQKPAFSVIEKGGLFYLSWSKIDAAESYQITGLTEFPIIINKAEETNYLNTETGCFEYKLTNLVSTKKYNVAIKAMVKPEYLGVENSNISYALVASSSVGISFAKLPKVKFMVSDKQVEWNFNEWEFYEEYSQRLSELYYSLLITNSQDEEILNESNLNPEENEFKFGGLAADTYTIGVALKGPDSTLNSNDYIIDSDNAEIEITKLKTVELGISADGKIVFDRTVEGVKNVDITKTSDFYTICANGDKLNNDEYSIEFNAETGQMMVSLTSLMGSETLYSVVVRRTKEISGDKYFVDSNESTSLQARNINVEEFKKKGNNFEFEPAILIEGNDVAQSYVIEGKHASNSGYSFYKEIEGGDEEYFNGEKYVVPIGELSAGAGEYIFTIKVNGKEIVSGNEKVAYLGDEEGRILSVIVLNNPTENQVSIENGAVMLSSYEAASENPLDVPKRVVITFEKGEAEIYGDAITLEYKNIKFENKKFDLGIPESYLEAGEYNVYVQFVGDGDQIVSSSKIQGNGGNVITKIQQTSIFVYDGKLCWNEISGANYRLFFDGEEEYTELTPKSENILIVNNIVTLNTSDWAAGRKVLKIQVVKDGSLPSVESEEFVVFKLNAMEIEANSDNGVKVISWPSVLEGATSQEIYLDKDKIDTVGTSNSSWIITSNQEVGVHNFTMISKGSVDTRLSTNNVGYLTSDASNSAAINFIEPTVVTNLKNGILEWAEVKGILTYEVSLYKMAGYPETKELASSKTITTISETEFDLNDFEIYSGAYVVEVKVSSIDALSEIMTSSHEEVETNYLKVLKIDELSGHSIYKDVRVENGMFAFDITSDYLEAYKSLLKSINTEAEDYDDLTLESVASLLTEEASEQTKQILYSLVNFNAVINGRNLTGLTPSNYSLMEEDGYLTLYYDIKLGSDEYKISFTPIGNTCSSTDEVIIGVLNGEPTDEISAIKPDKPICPVLVGSQNSIVKGVLIWSAPTGFEGKYIVEFKEVETGLVELQEVGIVDKLSQDKIWEAIEVDGKIQLDLNRAVNLGALKPGVEYVISIYTAGTVNSKGLTASDVKYLTGVKNTLTRTFVSLNAPISFSAQNGEIYWSGVESAIGYELSFFAYDKTTGDVQELGIENLEPSINKYNVVDDENLPAGTYMIGIKAKGDGNYKIDSKPAYAYFVKADKVEVFVENGYFAFEELKYNEIDIKTGTLGAVKGISNYQIRIQERNSATGDVEHDWLTEVELKKVGSKYYFELPDELKHEMSDYRLEVYARGNNNNLLSGDVSSSKPFGKSEIPSGFELDKNGIISWTDLDGKYFYAVYVRPTGMSVTRVDFDGLDYTASNSFDINAYAASVNKFGEYEVYIKALHDNETDIQKQSAENTELISSKSITLKLNVIAPPIIKLEAGNINWQTDSFQTIKEEITDSYLIITGKIFVDGVLSETAKTIKVRCSNEAPLFVNSYYYAVERVENNEEYYLVDLVENTETATKIALAGGEQYDIKVHYIGYDGAEELKEGETYLCSSKLSNSVSGVECLQTPVGLIGANKNEVSAFDNSNYVKWAKVNNSSGYEVVVYSKDESGVKEEFGVFNSIENAELFEQSGNYAYFALDAIIEEFALLEYVDRAITVKVKAIGSTWSTGIGLKKISSNYTAELEIKYPSAPTEFAYNGAGLISWRNNATGTIMIEVKYTVHNYYRDANGSFEGYENGANYPEIERTTSGVGTISAVDRITVSNAYDKEKGTYQLKYLTENIEYIKIWVETANFISVEKVLSSVGDSPALSSQTKKFMLFDGGDGSIAAPFKIKNETSFRNIAHYLDSNFVIVNDIALTKAIQPIGSKSSTVGTVYEGSEKVFTGSINGDIEGTNAKITNVKLQADETTDAYFFGLFYGISQDAKIENIDVQFANGESSKISASNKPSYVGGIVANENRGTISHVNISGNIYIAGNSGDYALENIIHLSGIATTNYGVITGTEAGAISTTSLVVSTNTASYVGGISYYNYGTISYYGVDGVSLKGSSAGGIAVMNAGTIENSYSKASITLNGGNYTGYSSNRVGGGIAGIMATSALSTASCTIKNSYSETEITVQNMSTTCYVGGLVGQISNGSIANVYVLLYSNDSATQNTSSMVVIGKVYGYYAGGTCSATYYNSSNLGTYVAGRSVNSGNSATGNESRVDSSPSLYLDGLGDAFVADGQYIKLAWQN